MFRKNDYRTPRNMNDAFGPYSELDIEPDSFLNRLFYFIGSIFR